jgi:exopolysaccharide biosynthesis protein
LELKRLMFKYFLATALYSIVVGLLCYWFLSSRITPAIKTHVEHIETHPKTDIQPESPVFSTGYRPADKSTVIHVYQRHTSTYNAYIMTVSDPKRISMVTTKYLGSQGQTVEDMVKEQNAIAGINGGSFLDTNWQGTGGQAQGIVISDGKVINSSKSPEDIIGFTSEGRLVSGTYSLNELKDLHVVQALMFGPTLVAHGVGVIQGAGDWGYAPRTAIGQRADGTVIMIVTDGRGLTGGNDVGPSLGDIQDLMLQYGAVTAANLDGGSSATMVNHGDLVNEPTDILGERSVATAIIVR